MNQLLIIAHAPIASALRAGVLHVFADAADAVAALDVPPDAAPEATLAAARAALQGLATACGQAGVLVLADALGATPCNVAQRLLAGPAPDLRLLAGASLPMALRGFAYRHLPLAEMAQRALAGGQQGMVAVAAPASTPLPAPDPSA